MGRTLLEVFVTEFRDRTSEYYQWAIHKGYCNVNGKSTGPDHVIRQSDRLHNRVHRHEPAVTAEPIRVLHRDDKEGRLVVAKPGSIPVHAAGRYYKLTLLELIKRDLGIDTIYTSNRLDRLTSGIMVCSTNKQTCHALSEDFALGKVRKAYVCRVKGEFPAGEVVCKEPLLQCDRQTGVSVVHPNGKECETIFNRMSYDRETDTTVVFCRPITGRTHQIRAHVQYLGHPIPNDPIYGHPIWKRYPPQIFKALKMEPDRWKVEPESSLSVYGCIEIDEVAAGLKMGRDEKEDWSRWKDEAMFKAMLDKDGFQWQPVAGPNGESPAMQRLRARPSEPAQNMPDESQFCDECKIPLSPDPEDESELYIYLHAIKYETDEWSYEDDLPWWAHEDWTERDRGYSEGVAVVVKTQEEPSPAKHDLMPAGRDKAVSRTVVGLPDVRPILSIEEKDEAISAPLQPCQSAVMFEVFGGMEDFAAIDIHQKIQAALPSEIIEPLQARLHTSHVAVAPGLGARAALDLFLAGRLSSVKMAYLKIGDERIPTEILEALEKERNETIALQAGINRSKRSRARAKKAGELVEEMTPRERAANSVQTVSEKALVQVLLAAWDRAREEREKVLCEWRIARGIEREPTLESKLLFRGRVDRSGFSLPTLNTEQMERIVGAAAWRWLNGLNVEEGPWGVNLEEPDLDVVVKMLPGWSDGQDAFPYWRTKNVNFPGSFVYLVHIPPLHTAAHRVPLPGHLTEGGTSLARFRSYTLATALPVIQSGRTSSDCLRIWEPCVGTGSIAIELDTTLAKRQCDYQIYGSDLFEDEIERGKQVCRLCKTSSRLRLATVDSTNLDECLAFLGGPNVLDGIVTDLPWGRRVLNHMTISVLYPALLKVWVHVLKPGASVVLMTAEQRTFMRAIKAHEADMRRRNTGWMLGVERVETKGISGDAPADLLDEESRPGKMRTVACGYDVSVIFLRKRPLVD